MHYKENTFSRTQIPTYNDGCFELFEIKQTNSTYPQDYIKPAASAPGTGKPDRIPDTIKHTGVFRIKSNPVGKLKAETLAGGSHDWIFDCADFRGADEYTGSVQYAGYQNFRDLGGQRVCAADGFSGVHGRVALHGQELFCFSLEGGTQIHALRGRDRSGHHLYRDQEHEYAGTGQGRYADRHSPADRGVRHRTAWDLRRGEAASGTAESIGHGGGDNGYRDL